jgi:plasmid stabilization system protein ParE
VTKTRLRVTKNAQENIRGVRRYLRREASSSVAKKIVTAFVEQFEELRLNPEAFRVDPRFATSECQVRSRILYNYLIIYFYDPSNDYVVILDVVHGASDLPSVC